MRRIRYRSRSSVLGGSVSFSHCLLRPFPSTALLHPPLRSFFSYSGGRRGVADGKGRSRRGRGRARGYRCARGHCPWRRRPGPTRRWTPLRMGSPGPSGRRHRRPGVNAAARGVAAPSVTSVLRVRPSHSHLLPRSPRPSRRGRGRTGGRAARRLKKVAGAYLSPLVPHPFRPEVAQ